MNTKSYLFWASVIFSGVCLFHAIRTAWAIHLYVDGEMVPLWLSAIATFVSGWMAYSGIRLLRS